MTLRLVSSSVGVFSILVVILLSSGCGGDSERDLMSAARASLSKGDEPAAILLLKSAIQKSPDSGEARLLLGQTLLKMGDPSNAVLELEKARDLKQPDAQVMPTLAESLLAVGQSKKVIDLYGQMKLAEPKASAQLSAMVAGAYVSLGALESGDLRVAQALQQDPENKAALLLKAKLAAARGALEDALSQVSDILNKDPKRLEAWQFKGQLLAFGKDDVPGGMAAFRSALSVDKRYLPAHSALLRLLLRNRDVEGFKSQFKELKATFPGHPETQYYEIQLALLDKDLKRARDGAQALLRQVPENPLVLQLSGAVEFQVGSLQAAASHFNKALQLSPGLPAARRMLAETQLRAGQPAKAIAVLQPLLAASPPNPEVLALAAEAHLQGGDLNKAEALFGQAAKANPTDPKARTALALAQMAKGNLEAGLSQLDALAASDKSTYADMALISARLRNNEFDAALAAVDRLQAKTPGRPLAAYLRGQVLLMRKDKDGGRKSLLQAIDQDPAYLPAIAAVAALDVGDRKYADAQRRLEAFLVRDPNNIAALLAVADIQRKNGAKPDDVTNLLSKAVKLEPADASARLALVAHLLAQRQVKAALAAAQEAVAALPDHPQVTDQLGRAQLAAGDVQQAIATYNKLAIAQPALPDAYLRLGDVYMAARNYRSAIQSLNKALAISPKLVVAQRGLVQIAMLEKRVDDALKVARAVQAQRPSEPTGFLMEADIHSNQRNWNGAISAVRAALARSKTTDIAKRLHAAYMLAGRTVDADQFATAWEREQPSDVEFIIHQGAMALERKEYAKAETKFRQVLASRPGDAMALNNVAWLMLQQNKPGALAFAEKANALLPDMPWIMDTLAAAYWAEKQLSKAIEWQQKAVAKSPRSSLYRLALAKLYIDAGKKAEAKVELEKLLAAGDKFTGSAEAAALLKGL